MAKRVGGAEAAHVVCGSCLPRWFQSQSSLREESELPPLIPVGGGGLFSCCMGGPPPEELEQEVQVVRRPPPTHRAGCESRAHTKNLSNKRDIFCRRRRA